MGQHFTPDGKGGFFEKGKGNSGKHFISDRNGGFFEKGGSSNSSPNLSDFGEGLGAIGGLFLIFLPLLVWWWGILYEVCKIVIEIIIFYWQLATNTFSQNKLGCSLLILLVCFVSAAFFCLLVVLVSLKYQSF